MPNTAPHANDIRDQILNDGLNLAMEWGEEWLRPIQERLLKLYPDLSRQQLDEYDSICRAAMRFGHSQAYELTDPSDQTASFEQFRLAVLSKYRWINPSNLSRLYSQSIYYLLH